MYNNPNNPQPKQEQFYQQPPPNYYQPPPNYYPPQQPVGPHPAHAATSATIGFIWLAVFLGSAVMIGLAGLFFFPIWCLLPFTLIPLIMAIVSFVTMAT